MKIAIFSDNFLPIISGVNTSVVNAVKKLSSMGHSVMIFAAKPPEQIQEQFGKNVILNFMDNYKNVKLIQYKEFRVAKTDYSVLSKIKTFRPDVIHVHLPTPLGWTGVLYAKMNNIPLVTTYHGYFADFLGHSTLPKRITSSRIARSLAWSYQKKFHDLSTIIISPSETTRKELLKMGFKAPIRVVTNGVNTSVFHALPGRSSKKILLHVGRLSYEKKVDVVIDAFKIVAKKNRDCILHIVGTGPQEQAYKESAGSLLGKRIFFFGHVEHEKLAQYYSKGYVFATGSTIETEGLVLLEAMACGCPVVGVDVRAIPEIVKNNLSGFIVKEGDSKSMALKILKLLENRPLRNKMSQKAVEIAGNYSLDMAAVKLENTYLEAISIRLQKGKRIKMNNI